MDGMCSICEYCKDCEKLPFMASDIKDMSVLLSKITSHHENNREVQMTMCTVLKHLGHCYEYSDIFLQNRADKWITRAMKMFINDAHVQKEACAALSELISEYGNIEFLIRNNTLDVILQSMGNYLDNVDIQLIGFRLLMSITPYVNENPTYFINMNTYDQIQMAMTKHIEHPGIQKRGISAIGNVSHSSQYGELIAETEFENIFLKAMHYHCHIREVLINACLSMANVLSASSNPWEKKSEISSVILKRMDEHMDDNCIQTAGFNALCGLVNNEHCTVLMDQGVYYVLSNAMKRYTHNFQLQYHAFKLLVNLAYEKDVRHRLFDCGVHELISQAMNNHFDSPSIQQYALLTLLNLSIDQCFSNTLITCGVYHLISQAMRHHMADSQVQDYSCRVLYCLSLESELKFNLIQKGADKLIQQAKEHHPDNRFIAAAYNGFLPSSSSSLSGDEQIEYLRCELGRHNFEHYFSLFSKNLTDEEQQKLFLYALCKYCRGLDEDTFLKLFRNGVYEYTSQTLKYHPDNSSVQGLFCSLLHNLSCSDATSALLLEKGAFEIISKIMNRFPNCSALQNHALLTLANFCVKESNAESCFNKGVVSLVIRTMENNVSYTNIQSNACWILTYVAELTKHQHTLLFEYNIYEILVRAIDNHEYHMDVQEAAFSALETLAKENATTLINKGITDVVSKAKKQYEANTVMEKLLDNIMNQIS